MPKIHEDGQRLRETTTNASGRMHVCAISAGLGSSGYYSPAVIEAAATDQLIEAGTPLYLDHPRESDRTDLPERSVRDIAAFFTAPATYDAATESLVGEVQVVGDYRDLITDLAPHIGLSIHGSATDVTEGEHEGRRVPVIEGLAAIDSVDFVTKAGRGGRVLSLLESAGVRPAAREAAKVSATAWSEFNDADFDDDQYRRACVLDRGEDAGDTVKARYGLPVREPNGAVNRNAVHAAAGMLGKVKGASADAKTAAAKKLVALYRGPLAEDPPAALLKAAGQAATERVTVEADPAGLAAVAARARQVTDDAVEGVTKAGRAARVTRTVAQLTAAHTDLDESLVRDTESTLRAALVDAYGNTDTSGDDYVWAWVRDFDPDGHVVYFELSGPGVDGGEQLFSQPYTGDGTDAALSGDRSEVRVVTTYVPASGTGSTTPADRPGTTPTKESKEDTMDITEAEHTRLQETAGRAEAAEAELARRDRTDAANKIIDEAKGADGKPVTFTALERLGLLADLPTVESGDHAGQLEVAVFGKRVTDAVKVVTEAHAGQRSRNGEGTVTGFGARHQEHPSDLDEAAPTTSPWGRPLTEQKGA